MSTNSDSWNIIEGTDVVGSDGEKLGTVDRVENNYILAKKGWLFPQDYYIPSNAVSSVEDGRIVLNVTKDTVLNQGWDTVPSDGVGTSSYNDGAIGTESVAAADTSTANLDADYDRSERRLDDPDNLRVSLAEEELTATRRTVDRGEVRVEKDVVSEEQTLEVPTTEERVNVTRRVVDRELSAGDTAFEDDTISVPVHGEEVDLQKQARVVEEIELTKEAVGQTERVSDTVRKERARVTDTTGDVASDTDELPDTDEKNRRGV